MKTYLMDSFNRYKRFSEQLDVKAILCNKSWWIFNDSGEKEIYIFQEDSSLIISLNGNVINANWKYIPANQSLIINSKEQSYMLHPTFLDEKIFALQKDGTEQYSFMIIEAQLQSFKPKSLSELNSYFEQKKLAEIEAEQKRLQMQREEERRRALEAAEAARKKRQQELEEEEEARRKKWQELREKNIRIEIKKETKKVLNENLIYRTILCITFILAFTVPVTIFIWGYNEGVCNINDIKDGIAAIFCIISFIFAIWSLIYYPLFSYVENGIELQIRTKYQKKNLGSIKDVDFESIDELEARIKKEKQGKGKNKEERIEEEDRRKLEEQKRLEWSEYLKRRDQRDQERIEMHRIEREKRERGENR